MTRVLSAIYCLSAIASIVSYSPSALALEPSAIYAKAKEFTVQIDQIDGDEKGTGTIIANNNGTYTVLTCWHVMDKPGSYQITTADGATHQVTKIENLLNDVDLATITFSSSNTYPVAELGDSTTATSGLDIYVVGYNAPFVDIQTRQYLTESAEVQGRRETHEKGYELIHSGTVTPGSSGGGIFDNEARLIGVNGQVFSEANTNKAYANAIPLEIYLAAYNNLEISRRVGTSADFYDAGNNKHKQRDYSGAIADYDEAIRLDPNNKSAYYNRGNGYLYLGDYKSAIADYDEAIRLDPDLALAYYIRGLSYDSLRKYDLAIADYDEAIRLDPSYTEAYNNRGASYYDLEDYDSAIANYDQAIRLDPNRANAYYGRGSSYRNIGNSSSAIRDF